MRYHDITKVNMNNGDGLRTVLWLSGCDHHCRNCQNEFTWDPEDGLLFDDDAKAELFDALANDYIDGITLSGGDPLYVGNREGVEELLIEIKDRFPEKNVWMYTGYDYEQVKDLPLLEMVDVLVDGKYIDERRNVTLHWIGSDNQRVIDVRSSFREGNIVLYTDSLDKK